MPAEYQALLVGDKIRPLPHPLERSGLRAENQTYLSASLRGVFLQVERWICLQCGHIFDSPRLAFAGVAGCLPALLVAVAGFAVLRFAAHITTGTSLFAAWALLVGLAVLPRRSFQSRRSALHSGKVLEASGQHCTIIVPSLPGQPLGVCPARGRQTSSNWRRGQVDPSFNRRQIMKPNKITGGPRRLLSRTPSAGRIAQFWRWAN